MTLKAPRIVVIGFMFSFFIVRAQQTFSISGKVLDNQSDSIEIGDVLLLKEADKKLVKYTTLMEGAFAFEEIPVGSYILEISSLGFAPYQMKVSVDENIELSINLSAKTEELNEVEVIAAKNPIEYDRGNLKVNVQNPYFSSIPNPIDILSRLPNVQVAPDRESISILGKGTPLIYLGNQRIGIEEFNALPIDGIETIELINNPSVKYEAEGRVVLLVTLKRPLSKGFRGSIAETASAKRNFNNYLAFNSSFAEKNWTIRGSMGYNQLLQWESNSFLFEIPERNVLVDYLVLISKNKRVQLNPGLGFYFQWNETDYLSLNASARLQTDNAPFFTDTFIADTGNEEMVRTNTDNENSKNYYSTSLNFNKKLTDGWNLFTGFQYSGYEQKLDTEIRNSWDNTNFVLDQTRQQEYSINSLAFRLDAEKKMFKDLIWETGVNVSRAKADAFTEIQRFSSGEDTQIDFSYSEELYAAYSSLSGKLNKKADFELGFRVEHNKVDGATERDDLPIVNRANTNLFPKINFSVQIDSINTLTFNYARSIQRPDFSRASSITVFINPFLEGSGNVNLRPTFTNELSLNYQWGKKTFFSTFYRNANPVHFTISYDSLIDTAVLSQVNLEEGKGFYFGLTLPFTKGIWTTNNTISLNYNQLMDSGATFAGAKPYLYLYTNHQLQIAKDTSLVIGAWALGKRQEGIFKRNGMAVFEASISKTFFEKWDCTLRFNDITRAMNFEESYALNGVAAEGVYFVDAREMALSIKYRFGGAKESNFKNRDVDANLKRIK